MLLNLITCHYKQSVFHYLLRPMMIAMWRMQASAPMVIRATNACMVNHLAQVISASAAMMGNGIHGRAGRHVFFHVVKRTEAETGHVTLDVS